MTQIICSKSNYSPKTKWLVENSYSARTNWYCEDKLVMGDVMVKGHTVHRVKKLSGDKLFTIGGFICFPP